ncbi:MAG TPA: GNAT family N-acetyltransferase [Planococcus sp. (in: firmicutes)]|nr:GNAT family N-acetyltransferase [Planococcus sp. (in: firmicutes)]
MFKAALFDLDGTLLDRDRSVASFIEVQYDRFPEELGHIPKERYVQRFIELDARGYRWKDRVYQQLIEEFSITDISWEIMLADYVSRFKNHCMGFPGLEEMLRNLEKSGIQLAIITNGPGQLQMDSIRALGIEAYFRVILVSGIEGVSKPDPRIFEKALGTLGVKAHEAVYIGDNPDNDIAAAKAVGMSAIWMENPYGQAPSADFSITHLQQLPALITNDAIEISEFEPLQAEEIVALFYGTVHSVNAADYVAEQLGAWAPEALRQEKVAQWRVSLARNKTFVAWKEGNIVGFADLAAGGKLDRLYVHKDYQGQGIAGKLLGKIEQEARQQGMVELVCDASITAKPFFEHYGFAIIERNTVERLGVQLQNYRMAKALDDISRYVDEL